MPEQSSKRPYFHDRFVLLLLTINIFLTFVCIAAVLLRLGDTGNSYIQSYRANLGLNAYNVGGVGQIISFAVFSLAVLIGQFYFSFKLYDVRKQIAWIVMLMATLLLLLSIIVSNSLLQLR